MNSFFDEPASAIDPEISFAQSVASHFKQHF
jgi:ABC-type polar amino acid transport system ATPase subunit